MSGQGLTPYVEGPQRILSDILAGPIVSSGDMRDPNETSVAFTATIHIVKKAGHTSRNGMYEEWVRFCIVFDESGWRFVGTTDREVNPTTRKCNAGTLELTTGDKEAIEYVIMKEMGI